MNASLAVAVGDLFLLIDQADGSFLADLGRTLGLKAEKIEELQGNVRTVAREDYRKRIWGSPDYPADRLIYPCEGGAPDLLRAHIGTSFSPESVPQQAAVCDW